MNLNKVFVLGRLTADPQLRSTPSGQQVANFGVATNRMWTDKSGNRQEEAEFHNIVVWGRQAEIASQFLAKGSLVLIEGRLRTRSWQDQQGGNRRTTEIIADRIQLGPRAFGQRKDQAGPSGSGNSSNESAEGVPTVDISEEEEKPKQESEIKPEDIPF